MILKDRDRILIVGGGPAGTSLALFLMEEGVAPSSLLIVDKAYFPRDKLCGGVVTANGIQEILPFLPQGIFTSAYRIKGYLLKTPFGDLFVRETFDSFVYSRKDLDYFLLKEVEKRGVEILEGREVKEFGWGREGVTVRFQTGSTHTFWGGIFADGALGVSRKIFPRRRYLPLVEGVFQGDDSFEKEKIFFDLTLPYEGVPVYRWVIPYFSRERYLFKVGAMGGKEDLKGEVLRKAVQSLVEGYSLSPVEDLHGWVLKPYSPFFPLQMGRWWFTGDAYGVDPLLGEGIGVSFGISSFLAKKLGKNFLKRKIPNIPFHSFLFTPLGWNLLFRKVLSFLLYGKGSRFSLFTLARSPFLRSLYEGKMTYNTLTRGWLSFTLSFFYGMIFYPKNRSPLYLS